MRRKQAGGSLQISSRDAYFPVAVAEDSVRGRPRRRDINAQPLDLLVQRGQRNLKLLRRFRLIPVRAFQHVANHAPLNLIHDLEQRTL